MNAKISAGYFWRVFRMEWTVVYCSDSDGELAREECLAKFRSSYEGRVRGEAWRVMPWSKTDPGRWPWTLELFLPVMKGEYRTRPEAQEHADRVRGMVVLEGSPTDKAIFRYGKQMLGEDSAEWLSDTG